MYNENLCFNKNPWFVDWLGFWKLIFKLLMWNIARPHPQLHYVSSQGGLVIFAWCLTMLQTISNWGWLDSRGGSFPLWGGNSIIVAIFYPFSQFCEIDISLLSLQTQTKTAPNLFQRGVEYGKYEYLSQQYPPPLRMPEPARAQQAGAKSEIRPPKGSSPIVADVHRFLFYRLNSRGGSFTLYCIILYTCWIILHNITFDYSSLSGAAPEGPRQPVTFTLTRTLTRTLTIASQEERQKARADQYYEEELSELKARTFKIISLTHSVNNNDNDHNSSIFIYIYIYTYIHTYIYTHIYIYI